MRVVFAGTPDPAVPALRALLGSAHEVAAVVTRPDAPAGRGRRLHPSPVRAAAQAAGLPVLTPTSTRDPQLRAELTRIAPDACPVVAFGGLIPPDLLALPRHGWINLHFSLLPAWRGAAPVQHALLAGDEVTGATTFVLEEGLDTGPVLGTLTEQIRPTDTAGTLLDRLATAGADLLVATLDALESGAAQPVPQPTEGISHAPKLTVEDARVDWTRPAYAVDRQVRGCTPAPGAWTTFRGARLKVVSPVDPVPEDTLGEDTLGEDTLGEDTLAPGALAPGAPASGASAPGALAPGVLRIGRRTVHVGTGSHPVRLDSVQPHGKQAMAAADWARGARIEPGEVLGEVRGEVRGD